jgi:hypothetical protein
VYAVLVVLRQTSLHLVIMPNEGDEVGADVYPWPGAPTTPLDEGDEVGADVYPWPGQPMITLDEHCTT